VGYTGTVGDGTPKPVILSWNGVTWKQAANPITGSASLYAVAVYSGRRAWAVGQTGSYGSVKPNTVILRWNGSAWTR
jgi:hypothetical protein